LINLLDKNDAFNTSKEFKYLSDRLGTLEEDDEVKAEPAKNQSQYWIVFGTCFIFISFIIKILLHRK
jgi:uncharacterized protein YqhQ